jgi:hypothetical protein
MKTVRVRVPVSVNDEGAFIAGAGGGRTEQEDIASNLEYLAGCSEAVATYFLEADLPVPPSAEVVPAQVVES